MSITSDLTETKRSAVDLFCTGLSQWGMELDSESRRGFEIYADMLVDWNASRFNLTRLVSPEQIALNHFLDSVILSQIAKVRGGAVLIDVGTGAGFPGLAVKMLRRDIKLVLIESTGKKLNFCRAVAEEAGLTNIEFVHGRAEDPAIIRRFAEAADIVTARALAPMRTLLDWTAPLVTPNGTIVAWKGSKVHEEIVDAQRTASKLAMKMEVLERTLKIDGCDPVNHYYVVCRARE
jgi:16S rRNA (guanine527-N7)-methyltransferase